MPRLSAKINRGKVAIEKQKDRLYDQRSKLISKYIQWSPIRNQFLFVREDVDRFCKALKEIEQEREDLKDALIAINAVGARLHKTGEGAMLNVVNKALKRLEA